MSGGGRGLRWYTRTDAAYREGGAGAALGDGDRHGLPGATSGSEVPGSAPDGEVRATPEDDGLGPAEELGQVSGKERGEAVPAGDHGKGGWTTVSTEKRESGSGTGVVVGVVEKGKTDSSNTTWREMSTHREVRSKHRYPL
jgi:hypothetical protein